MNILEPVIENYTYLPRAAQADVKRVEIADNLAVGGTTTSRGVMSEAIRYARENQIHLDLLIRPRGGNFIYNDTEIKIMEADIFQAQELGVDGIVLSALTQNNTLDTEGLETLIAAANGMELTFGTGFDIIRPQDRGEAVDWLADHQFDRILSSGSAAENALTDWQASARLTDSVNITLVPTGLTEPEVNDVAQKLNLNQFNGVELIDFN
ncbi:copper homeostasis protein CutC [Levilactobacillus bambusae]|uniref:Copper homeostasis protein cutC homolog n=1 Tax=Levilactobacillus bambusae TaxID=2024736 RepID=A0A2V1N3A5_9LACO|nr:copper homeostasis protein CutC [Levilactobacillus bambusae]PWG00625.1 copper resistance protein [Levilactobacillus bambusae]